MVTFLTNIFFWLVECLLSHQLNANIKITQDWWDEYSSSLVLYISEKKAILRREQSKQRLEIAKTGVERAVETDEATATAWLNEQLEALGVEVA